MSRSFITTSIAYVNAAPHVGYALEPDGGVGSGYRVPDAPDCVEPTG